MSTSMNMTMTGIGRELFTIAQVADELKVHMQTVRRWVRTGYPARSGVLVRLTAGKLGRRPVVTAESVRAFVRICAEEDAR